MSGADHPLAITGDCPDCRSARTTTSGRITACWVCAAMEETSLASPPVRPNKAWRYGRKKKRPCPQPTKETRP